MNTISTSHISLDYMTILRKKRSKQRAFFFLGVFVFILILLSLWLGNSVKNERNTQQNAASKKARKISGWLRTSGMTLLDMDNREVLLKGINYGELTPDEYIYTKPDLTNEPEVCKRWVEAPTKLNPDDIDRWGFNVVRLPIEWAILEAVPPTVEKNGTIRHTWNEKYVSAIDRIITELGKRKIAVILDMHQYLWSSAFRYIDSEDGWGCAGSGFPAWLYPRPEKTTFQKARCDFFQGKKEAGSPIDPQRGFIEAWQYLAGKYRDNSTVVGADLINEPWSAKDVCSSASLPLNDFYKKLGIAIRKVNPNITLIFEDSQDTGDNRFALTDPLPFDNTIYSFHLYTGNWRRDGITRIEKYVERAKRWKVPLFIGEFDAFGRADNLRKLEVDRSFKNEMQEMFTYFKENKVHWAFWAYSGLHSILIPGSDQPKAELLHVLQSDF